MRYHNSHGVSHGFGCVSRRLQRMAWPERLAVVIGRPGDAVQVRLLTGDFLGDGVDIPLPLRELPLRSER